MNSSRFVQGSSLLLAGWLAATFFNDVPAKQYQQRQDKAVTAVASPPPGAPATPTLNTVVLPASGSR